MSDNMASGPAPVEQQIFNFTLRGTPGATQATTTGTPQASYYSEATSSGIGTNGTTTGFVPLDDAFDGLDTTVPTGLTASRIVEATHGSTLRQRRNDPPGPTSAITQPFADAGVPNAVRVIDTFTNTTNAPITGTVVYSNDLGSDNSTSYDVQGSGSRYLVSNQSLNGVNPSDPTVTGVFGNTGAPTNPTLTFATGNDIEVSSYTITVQPGQTVRLVTFAVVTADVNRQGATTDANADGVPDEVVSDTARGRSIAESITNGGNAIPADSPFFTGISQADRATIANFRFVPLTAPISPAPEPTVPTGGDDYIDSFDPNAEYRLLSGNDTFNSLSTESTGGNLIYGNQGNDSINGGAGRDTLYGGQDQDTLSGRDGADLLYGNQGNDLIYGNEGADTIYGGQGDDRAFGGQGDDVLYGNLGNDIVYGNQGADIVYGNAGNDILYGGMGDDVLYGGMGDDILVGGVGNNILVGGVGADLYLFGANPAARDLVLGFNQGEGDRLSLGGQTYTTGTAQNGDALLTLSGGGTIDLAGIKAEQVNASFFAA